jgi:Mlc titration factor MtfA (ptsG expression regulator)
LRQISSLIRFVFLFVGVSVYAEDSQNEKPRPKLQIINGSKQPIDVFWLKSDTERVANGAVEPGKQTVITTTLGHRFELVGREDKSTATVTSEVLVQGYRFDPPSPDGVPSYYEQSVKSGGFPIVATAKVNPYALKEAAYLIDMLLAKRPDVREAMIKSGARLCIIGYDEFTTDQPEFAHLAEEKMPGYENMSGQDFWDARARGLGGSATDPFCSVGEENLLGYPGDPYQLENILIHEFAHNIHLRGLANVDSTFDRRLKAAYDSAMKAELWKGKYASTNHHEYFAEGVQSWFDNNRPPDHDHNHVNTRALLIEYDPGLAAMCREVFGDTVLKYSKPATRLTGHMEGYEPQKAPTFVWPERLKNAKAEIRAKAAARSQSANDNVGEVREIAGWTVHVHPDLLKTNADATAKALELLQLQLEEIKRLVPEMALAEIKRVPLWISPEYPKTGPTAEYHPGSGWLIEHKRNPEMTKGVEFTNVRIFEAETRRMPNFVLHELAHAYHDRMLTGGFGNEKIKQVFNRAKADGRYENIERQDSEGKKTKTRAYAMTNPMEYFAESTEAFFGRNDFFPYDKTELKQHDPEMFALLTELWNLIPENGTARIPTETDGKLSNSLEECR